MPKINIGALCSLDFQADQAYESLRRAMETGSLLDAYYAKGMYARMLNRSMNAQEINVGMRRNPALDRILLQYIVGYQLSIELAEKSFNPERPQRQIRDKPESLLNCIRTGPYSRVSEKASRFATAHQFEHLMAAMQYIRENYASPT